jgi:hypothetical protein
MEAIERLEAALRLLGDYELSGGSSIVSDTYEWKIIREEIDNITRFVPVKPELKVTHETIDWTDCIFACMPDRCHYQKKI